MKTRAGKGKLGGARGAREQGPIPGRQGGGERQTMHEGSSRRRFLLHWPIRLHLGT